MQKSVGNDWLNVGGSRTTRYSSSVVANGIVLPSTVVNLVKDDVIRIVIEQPYNIGKPWGDSTITNSTQNGYLVFGTGIPFTKTITIERIN